MDKPKKPNERLYELWKNCEFLTGAALDRELTEENKAEQCNEYNGWQYDAIITVFSEKAQEQITDGQFKAWYDFDPKNFYLWRMKTNLSTECRLWDAYLEKEAKDYAQYQELKEKFDG